MIHAAKQRPVITIKRGLRGYGFTLRAIKVYYDDSDYYTIQHLVIHMEHQGPAYLAGLKINDVLTHVNDEVVCGKMHHEIVKSIMQSVNNTLRVHAMPIDETNIKTGGRKRSPSKSKFSRPGFTNMHMQHHQQHGYQNMPFPIINNSNNNNNNVPSKFNPANMHNIRHNAAKSINNYYFMNQSNQHNFISHNANPNVNVSQMHLHNQQHHLHHNLNHPGNAYNLQNSNFQGNQNFYNNYSAAANNYFNQNVNYSHQFKVKFGRKK